MCSFYLHIHTLTAAQVEEYKLKYEEDNFRVIQPLNNRTVYENN